MVARHRSWFRRPPEHRCGATTDALPAPGPQSTQRPDLQPGTAAWRRCTFAPRTPSGPEGGPSWARVARTSRLHVRPQAPKADHLGRAKHGHSACARCSRKGPSEENAPQNINIYKQQKETRNEVTLHNTRFSTDPQRDHTRQHSQPFEQQDNLCTNKNTQQRTTNKRNKHHHKNTQ